MTESSAICQYLGTRHGDGILTVRPEEEDFGLFLNWVHFGEATLTFPQILRSRRSFRSGSLSIGSGPGGCSSPRCSAPGSHSSGSDWHRPIGISAQLPVGFLVDRLGSRRMLIAALLGAGIAFIALGLAPSYGHLLLAMALVGLTNAVFHPADYALLSAKIPNSRLGRAFSIHTFCGFLGNAVAPVTMLALVAYGGLSFGLIAAGVLAIVVALPLALARGVEENAAPAAAPGIGAPPPAAPKRG